MPHRHRRDGGQLGVQIEIAVRGGDPIAVAATNPHGSVAIREAFDIARRQV
ncbi:MAG: hypothetical protein JJE40_18485 [Vicinamibacteria bacterium]|nr:hypothetical protein [Vicinamibacteria bacterium]